MRLGAQTMAKLLAFISVMCLPVIIPFHLHFIFLKLYAKLVQNKTDALQCHKGVLLSIWQF